MNIVVIIIITCLTAPLGVRHRRDGVLLLQGPQYTHVYISLSLSLYIYIYIYVYRHIWLYDTGAWSAARLPPIPAAQALPEP